MSPSVRLRVLWERYVAPTRAERDPRFRSVLDSASVLGLKVGGLFGIVALLGVGTSVAVTSILEGNGMRQATGHIGEALSEKLFVFAVAAVFLGVARFRPGVRLSRWLVASYVVLGALVLTYTDIQRWDLDFLAAGAPVPEPEIF